MSAFVIREMTNNKHYSTLLKTCIWIVSGKFFKRQVSYVEKPQLTWFHYGGHHEGETHLM